MAKKIKKEQGIFLLMKGSVVREFSETTIVNTMRAYFPGVDFAIVLIEQKDDLKELLADYDQKVFIFDDEFFFQSDGDSCPAYQLARRLIMQHPQARVLMFTSKRTICKGDKFKSLVEGEIDENCPRIIWFKKLMGAKKDRPGLLAVEKILKLAFEK